MDYHSEQQLELPFPSYSPLTKPLNPDEYLVLYSLALPALEQRLAELDQTARVAPETFQLRFDV